MTDRISTDELRKLLGEATQGPWVKDRYQSLKSPAGILVGVWGSGIAHMDRSAETEANARLIAEAPQLAAEVIRLREALEKIERHYTDTGLASMHMAAIARAALNHKETDNE